MVLVVLGKLLLPRLPKKLFLAPFRAKGAVRKGATAIIHGVSATEPPAKKSTTEDSDADDESCEVGSIQYQEDGAWKDDEGMKFPGPQRLKMRLAVQPGARQLKFRYYFEEFGLVQLP